MMIAALSASQPQSLSLPTARRTATALTPPRPKILFDRRVDAKPARALDRRGCYSPISFSRLRLTPLRSDARDLSAIHKSP
jgi:hypothetical protein